MMSSRILIALVAMTMAGSLSASQLYVSPQGDDANPGTAERPLASLAGARDAVRKIKANGLKEPVTVLLHGGTYTLEQTVVFGLEDGGTADCPITYAAVSGETPIISGAKPIGAWQKTELQGGRVWVAQVPWAKGRPDMIKALFDGDRLLTRATSPSFPIPGPAPQMPGDYPGPLESRMTMAFPEGSLKDWDNREDIELFLCPTKPWLVNYLSLASIDMTTHTARFTFPATYSVSGEFVIQNAIEFLDEPGEWVFNSREGRLYYWPAAGTPGTNIMAPVLREFVRVEGTSDEWGDKDRPVQNLCFRGLTFTLGARDVWTPQDIGLQHDWDMWDKGNSLLRFRNAQACAVLDCRFVNSAGGAIRVDRYGQNIRIENNVIRNVGGTGILLCGYGPGTKDVNQGNRIINNEIENCGSLFWHSPAIFLWQSGGNVVAHNHIYNLGYIGMVVSGVRMRFFPPERRALPQRENQPTIRWQEIELPENAGWDQYERYMHARGNIIEYNEIHDCMKRLHDGNSIYLSAAGRDNLVRRNLCYRHTTGAMIRTDDDQFYTTITENLVVGNDRNDGGMTMKWINRYDNNIFINANMGGGSAGKPARGATLRHNLFYDTRPGPHEFVVKVTQLAPADIDNNVYFCPDATAAAAFLAAQRQRGYDQHSLAQDPLFQDAYHLDFTLAPDSPAAALGFTAFPLDGIGLLHDPALPRWRKQGGLEAMLHLEGAAPTPKATKDKAATKQSSRRVKKKAAARR